jgi:putative thioredoxin
VSLVTISLQDVIDATDETFATVVVERSRQLPVVVDLWATWCGPCKTLGPILEKVVGEMDGAVELVKVDVDANPQIAQAFNAQSIPAVFALVDGKVVDTFVGALPERDVRAFVEKLAPGVSILDQLAEKGDETSLRKALALDATNVEVAAALGVILVDDGRTDEAIELLTPLAHVLAAKTILARAHLAAAGVRLDGDVDLTLDHLLEQAVADEQSRAHLLEFLDALGPDDPRYVIYRRRLASRLF